MTPLRVGIAGLGTVGAGVVKLLRDNADLITARAGRPIIVTAVSARDRNRDRGVSLENIVWHEHAMALAVDPDVDIVVELIGGSEGPAKALVERALAAHRPVVTANKALLAIHGAALAEAAEAAGVTLAYEAAVAGGIPVIKTLREGLAGNRIDRVAGILNGTCNYILTRMEEEGRSYGDALLEAQRLGYAEEDPTLDVNGTDTAHKLAILARIAYHSRIPIHAIRCEGIQQITQADILSAKTMGARIKLLAVAKRGDGGLELRVAPTLVPLDHPLASVRRNYNGIHVLGSAAGPTLLVGQGAGALPTASAILADVVDVCTGRYQATASRFRFFSAAHDVALLPEDAELTGSYARFHVPDRAGVLASITQIFSQHGVSILSIHQGTPDAQGHATIEVVTHPLTSRSFFAAIHSIDGQQVTLTPTVTLRRL